MADAPLDAQTERAQAVLQETPHEEVEALTGPRARRKWKRTTPREPEGRHGE